MRYWRSKDLLPISIISIRYYHNTSGVALMMVLIVLAILVLLAIPFSGSMRISSRTSRNILAQTQAQLAAQGIAEYAVGKLSQSCDTLERYANQPKLYKTPDYDSPEEYQVTIDFPGLNITNPRGHIWSLHVQDEQGKINLNSVTPWILGNLIGSSMVSQITQPQEETIMVDTTIAFPPNGGMLWANGELISYQKALPDRFLECKRGLYRNSPRFTQPKTLLPGMLIIDARAYRICKHRLIQQEGKFTPYKTLEEIRQIADLGAYSIDVYLYNKISPFLTVHSSRDQEPGWIHEQIILQDLPSSMDPEKSESVRVSDSSIFYPGQTVRIQQIASNGEKTQEYAMVLEVQGQSIILDSHFTKKFEKNIATISILQSHPININSASPKVLYSIWKGLGSPGNPNVLDIKEADILASSVAANRKEGGFFKSISDFQNFLKNIQQQANTDKVLDFYKRLAFDNTEINAIIIAANVGENIRPRFVGISAPCQYEGIWPIWPPNVPLEYRNYDTYTLETSAIIGNDSGAPLAQSNFRQIVRVAPHQPLRWRIESQKDFAWYLQRLSGYRVITWPNLLVPAEVFPENNPENPDVAISLDTVPLYPSTPQGMFSSQYFPWNNTYEGITVPGGNEPKIILSSATNGEIAPGSISFWFHPNKRQNSFTIFDRGISEWQDRMALLYNRGELSFIVADTTYQKKAAEVWAEIELEPRWYHIQVGWHSTSAGGLDLWIDGQSKGKFCYRSQNLRQKATLSKTITNKDTRIPISDASGLDSEGVVKIGDEVIEYSNISGNTLIVREKYPNYLLEKIQRGARGTLAKDHPQGAWVMEFGYTDPLRSKVFPASTLSSKVWESGGLSTKLSSDLAINSQNINASTQNFPPTGIILLASINKMTNQLTKEIVKYDDTTGTNFQNCKRGLYNTKAAEFPAADTLIFPISIMLKDTKEYPNDGMVQIDREWVAYEEKYNERILLLSSNISDETVREWIKETQAGRKYAQDFRAKCFTISDQHGYGTKVFPVFQTQKAWLGKYDEVTIVSGKNPQQRQSNQIAWASGQWASFLSDVDEIYYPDSGTRILKFPSGELPIQTENIPLTWGKSNSEAFILDELKIVQNLRRSEYLLAKQLLSTEEELYINNSVGLIQDAGIWKIGDEYIGYQEIVDNHCENVIRGFAKSSKGIYSYATQMYPVFYLPVTYLRDSITASASVVPLNNAQDFSTEGYIICEDEIISYTDKSAGTNLIMPTNEQVTTNKLGLLRGMYGTKAASHAAGCLITTFPVRYWDRYLSGFDSSKSAYFECAKTAPGAFWKKLTWKEENPSPKYLQTVIRARFDGQPSWYTTPTNLPGGIYEFTQYDGTNLLHCSGDTLEIRVYFRYKSNAYSEGAWKEKTKIKSIFVEYLQPTQILEKD